MTEGGDTSRKEKTKINWGRVKRLVQITKENILIVNIMKFELAKNKNKHIDEAIYIH